MFSNPTVRLTFVGGARSVTGSNFLLEVEDGDVATRILIDCGLEQGRRFCESSNREPFPYDASLIDALFITHAHADHIGLYPKLVRDGFKGVAYATAPTVDLIPVMLEDAVGLIGKEAKFCNEEPPYDRSDVERSLSLLRAIPYQKRIEVSLSVSVTLYNAGHILGSALVLVETGGKRILFTGDLGRTPAILVPDPETPEGSIDYLVTESVYGNRTHAPQEESEEALRRAVLRIHQTQGTLLIPSFSLERTQIILATLDRFIAEKAIPSTPVFLDSPLASRVTEVYRAHTTALRESLRLRAESGDDPFSFPSLTVTYTRDEAKEIDKTSGPKIIIAGAGMSHGGRVRSHEATYLPHAENELLLVGYQVPGSLGRRLQDGARMVTIDKKKVRVRARVSKTGGFSAHADRDDLVEFAEKVNPKKAFVVLGEMEASAFLAQRLSGFLGIDTYIPQRGEQIEL